MHFFLFNLGVTSWHNLIDKRQKQIIVKNVFEDIQKLKSLFHIKFDKIITVFTYD